MGRKWNCSKRKRNEARNAQPLKGKALDRVDRNKLRRSKALLRNEITALMESSYNLWLGVDVPYPDRSPTKYKSHYPTPESEDKRHFMLTYVGARVWDHMKDLNLEELQEAHRWAQYCKNEMRDTYHKRMLKRNLRLTAFCGVVVASILIYYYSFK